jgi:hypothetical protein
MCVAGLMHVTTVPAQAAPPVHDNSQNAKVIGGLPYVDRTDTREATPGVLGATDTCYGNEKSVWYGYTPSRDRTVVFSTTDSDYFAPLTLWRRTANGFELVGDPCGQALPVDLQAGVTYAVMVSACCGDDSVGGNLVFRARRPIKADIDLDAEGTVSRASGDATVTGTLTCSRRTSVFYVYAEMRQRINDTHLALGGASTSGGGVCTPTAPLRFSVLIEPSGSVPFKAGNAAVRFGGDLCDDASCSSTPSYRDLVLLRWVT